MPTRRFGRTGLAMPVLTCGGMRFQHRWEEEPAQAIPPENQANLERIISRAFELGIRHVETARGYGTSEAQLGPVLRKLPRESYILQTKVAPMAEPDEFEKVFRISLSRLGIPWVDLLSLHGVNDRETSDWALRAGGCLERARQWQKQGLCRHVGFSTHGPPDLVEELVSGNRFDYVNLHWYYIFQEHTASLRAAQKNDMGVFIISPNDKGGMLYQAPEILKDLTRPLSPMAFNALFCLRRPEIHTLSIGAARPEDFDEHVRTIGNIAEAGRILPPLEERLKTRWEQSLPEDWRNNWQEGLPHWSHAPGQANLREILRLHNLAMAFGLVEYGKMRYNLLGQGGHWFPGQSLGALTGDDLLPVLQKCADPKESLRRLLAARDLFAGEKKKRMSSA
ncbi:MAG: aldo/keto reductase [Verrucomicrobia bacterium]|nr:aldo/keto reductase [Verrucomicrobiota bacterium]NBU68411.1 aldo/keto reductase [Verrucomicrobiota bacterium]